MGWGEFFALTSPMAWGLAVVLFRRSGETMPPVELNLCKNLLAFALMWPTLLIWGGDFPAFSAHDYAVILISGALGMALGDTLYFRAINLIGAARSGIVGSLLSPFVIVLSAVYLGERLAGWQWAGFALVMGGILLVTWRRSRASLEAVDIRTGALIGAAGVLMMAAGVVMVKPILETHAFAWVVGLRLGGGVLAMALMILPRRQWRAVLDTYARPQRWGMTLAGCFLGGYLGMLLWLAGYKLIPASEASIYNEAQGAFVVLFAWLFLGEAIGMRKLAGLALTGAGVIIMLLA